MPPKGPTGTQPLGVAGRGGRELTLLTEGRIELLGRIPRSSNETFPVQGSCMYDVAYAVYKPETGERPLSNFEPGLYRREPAAYLRRGT